MTDLTSVLFYLNSDSAAERFAQDEEREITARGQTPSLVAVRERLALAGAG